MNPGGNHLRAPKLIAAIFVAAVMSLMVAPAASAAVPMFSYQIEVSGDATITGCTGCGSDVTVPGAVVFGLGIRVTTIGENAFLDEGITSLTLPTSVTTIGESAFDRNPLMSADFEGAVSSIAPDAFAEPTRDHFTFAGWMDSASGVGTPDFPTSTAGATTVSAQWLGDPQTVTFDSTDGSTATADQTIAYGSGPTEPTAPFWSGHHLTGWFTAATGGTQWDFVADTITGNVTLFAQWAVNVRTVSSPPSAHAGDTITVTGTGFDPDESITVELHSDPVTIATTTADASGVFTASGTIPTDTPAGDHSIVAAALIALGGIALAARRRLRHPTH